MGIGGTMKTKERSLLVILTFSILLFSTLTGCNNTNMNTHNSSNKILNNEDTGTNIENPSQTEAYSENLESSVSSDDNDIKVEAGSQVNVVLKSIQLEENDDCLTILITAFESSIDYLDTFELEYNSDYNELSFINSFRGLPEDSILVKPNRVSRIAGSKFIKQWYKTGVVGDHNDRWNITFYMPIKYTIEQLSNPIQYKIIIQEAGKSGNSKYIVRSKSGSLTDAMYHFQEVSYRYYKDLGRETNILIIRDENGFFCSIESFDNEEEAESLLIQLDRLITEYGDPNFKFEFEIEKREN